MGHKLAWGVIIIGAISVLAVNVLVGVALLLIGIFIYKKSGRG